MSEEKKIYSAQEIADEMNMTFRMVCRFISSGELVATKTGGTYSVTEEDFLKFREYVESGEMKRHQKNIKSEFDISSSEERSTEPIWINISDVWENPGKSEMTFVDLFCGAGGLSRGLEMAGLNGICGLDFFKEAAMTYRRNFSHPMIYGDITLQETKDEFYKTVHEELNGRSLDIVAGGFPCQGFSMAGHRIVDDSRNFLYKELIEIVKRLNPKFVVCENVRGLRTMLGGLVEKKIISDFHEIGYEMNVAVLNAANYYVPQKRERVIFIGNRIDVTNYHPEAILRPGEYVTLGEAVEDLMNIPENKDFNHVFSKHSDEIKKRIAAVPEGGSLMPKYKEAYKKSPWNEPSCTVKENHGGTNLHPKLPRCMTARELARLQSFPDDFIFMGPKSKQLTQIGNAVPPLLGKAIGLAVRKSAGEL